MAENSKDELEAASQLISLPSASDSSIVPRQPNNQLKLYADIARAYLKVEKSIVTA